MMYSSQVAMIIIALIGVIGSVLTNVILNGKGQAVIEERLKNLTEEVHKHNNFSVKRPQMETEIKYLSGAVKDLKTKNK